MKTQEQVQQIIDDNSSDDCKYGITNNMGRLALVKISRDSFQMSKPVLNLNHIKNMDDIYNEVVNYFGILK